MPIASIGSSKPMIDRETREKALMKARGASELAPAAETTALDQDGAFGEAAGAAASQGEAYDDRGAEPRRLGRSMRIVLPLAAVAVVLVVFAWSGRSAVEAPSAALLDGVALSSGLEVTNARYWGEADDGSPFRVSAERARPDGPNPSRIELDGVKGMVEMPGGRAVEAKAADGVFKPKAHTLDLGGGVSAVSDDGYRLTADALSFDLRERRGESAEPVRIDGPLGELSAASMSARYDGDIVISFAGDVKVVIKALVERDHAGGASE